MTEKSRAAAKAEEVLLKMKGALAINTNNSMSSSAEVDNILGQMQKEATSNSKPKHMQVIGLEEEVRLKEVTIKGLHSKIYGLERQLYQSSERVMNLEVLADENKDLKAVIKEQEAKIINLEKVQEENKKLEETLSNLKEKNTNVLKTAKDHQKGWKDCISKLEVKISEKDAENRLLRSNMTKLMRKLEGTIAEFSDLNGLQVSLSLASSSESEDCDTIEDKNTAHEESRDDDCEQETTVEKGMATMSPMSPVAEKINSAGRFLRCQAAIE